LRDALFGSSAMLIRTHSHLPLTPNFGSIHRYRAKLRSEMALRAKVERELCGEGVYKEVDKGGYPCGRLCIKCG